MKMMRTLLLMFSLLIFAWQVNAQTPVKIYSGESVPTEQGWTEQKLDATVNDLAAPTTQTATSGVLKLTSTNTANQFSQLNWFKTGLDFSVKKGFTLEIKAKITSADKTGAFNIQGFDKTGKGFRIGILSNAVTEQTDPLAATNILKSSLSNGDGFHIYRIEVSPKYEAEVFCDDVSLGTFKLQTFQFDNIIENGGFEDEEFPDFITQGTLQRVDDPYKLFSGNYSFEMYNDGLVTDEWGYIEGARTREIAVKPETDYQFSLTRRRTFSEPYCWRDMGSFYDYEPGTLGLKGVKADRRADAEDHQDTHIWGGCNSQAWLTHNSTFASTAEAKTIRFEFPTWIRDGNKFEVTTSLDNFIFREKPVVDVGPTYDTTDGFPEVVFPETYTNLIKNGDFENIMMNNDGSEYEWALASNGGETENIPVDYNPMWNGDVRIQDQHKPDDFESGHDFYAHSGVNALRFSTLGKNENNFDFTFELKANKTYRFNFFHRVPRWPDQGWLKLRIGDNVIWGHRLVGDWERQGNNVWVNADFVFTTTDDDKTLHLYTESDSHGDWWNVYLDDLVLYEVPDGTPLDPQIVGKTNLIENGDFEDVTIGNDGKPYTWALASTSSSDDDNYPVAWSDMWGSYVRLQDKQKIHDTGLNWAHSGNNSLRFSFLDDFGAAQRFEGLTGGDYELPGAFRINIDFKKELEPNKTYTFIFWIKGANYNDRGRLVVGNGEVRLWDQEFSTKYINWIRQSITFSTTELDHTLRLYSEFGGWYNFYLDDIFLFEEDVYIPAPEPNGITYLAFGKSTGTSSTNVEIEYITLADGTTGLNPVKAANNLVIYPNPVVNGVITIDNIQSLNGKIEIFSIVGTLVKTYNVTGSTTTINVSALSAGTYIVKVDGKSAIMLKK